MGIEDSIIDDAERKQLVWYDMCKEIDRKRLPKRVIE